MNEELKDRLRRAARKAAPEVMRPGGVSADEYVDVYQDTVSARQAFDRFGPARLGAREEREEAFEFFRAELAAEIKRLAEAESREILNRALKAVVADAKVKAVKAKSAADVEAARAKAERKIAKEKAKVEATEAQTGADIRTAESKPAARKRKARGMKRV